MSKSKLPRPSRKLPSYSEIHRRSGYSLAHVSKVFAGKRKPSIDAAKKIATACGLTLDQLYSRIGAGGGS